MTVCIASITDSDRSIVVATDQMASMPSVSLDHTMVKADFLGWHWLAMWAGDDIAAIPAIHRRAVETLKKQDLSQEWTQIQVADALSEAYQAETRERAVKEILSPFGLDMLQFLGNGAHMFQDAYQGMLRDIQQFDLGVTFLVAGFHDIKPSIFVVSRRGQVIPFNKPGFWAIGAGDSLALGALALRQHNTHRSTEETIYAVLEAKFAAEKAPGVGKHTTLAIMPFDDLPAFVSPDVIDSIRAIWERQALAPPHEALLKIQDWWRPRLEAISQRNTNDLKKALDSAVKAAPPVPQGSKRVRKVRPPSQA